MTGTLIALIVLALVGALWSSARDAHERASALARASCQRAGVQLLDQTVSLDQVGIARNSSGRLSFRRRYRFDYSQRGDDRRRSALALVGNELLWIQEPVARDGLD